jgi:zinc/manganese transport system permease protein
LLAVGIMMLPAIAARLWTSDMSKMIALATALGLAASIGGLILSYHTGLPTGPTIILIAGIFYLVSVVVGPQGGLWLRFAPTRHRSA